MKTRREDPGVIANRISRQIPCTCCSIFFNSHICPQCQVAGCAATVGAKKHKCRLQGNMIAAMELSEFQVRAELAELRTKYAELLTESQRLARQNLEYEANWPKGLPRLEHAPQVAVPIDAAGVDPNAQRGKISMLAGAH